MTTLGTFNYDKLFAGDAEVVIESAMAGATMVRGTVVGKITASGKIKAVDSAAVDGSKDPYGILADDVAADGDPAVLYLTGEFNEDAITFGGTDTADTHRLALRNIGIFLKQNQKA
ncbi:hypothetical protein J2Z76_000453 [Sedimentibacter acidaminivorans]|uniref:Head decoration protein n=1 Tax=Sedimentibacter acidaminivorans TaxID=913099 RepID=A0ABS4GB26_9FIRM|nr:head decoration protein [Sedimentibacter acidaminivorans]MBP1924600.1 hypothetical protein [Sedimentibacter acidaminivorans]